MTARLGAERGRHGQRFPTDERSESTGNSADMDELAVIGPGKLRSSVYRSKLVNTCKIVF